MPHPDDRQRSEGAPRPDAPPPGPPTAPRPDPTPDDPPKPPDDGLPPPEFDDPRSFQQIVNRFLDAELDHSVRAYGVANDKLKGVLRALDALERLGTPLPSGIEEVTSTAIALNAGQLNYRHAVTEADGRPRTHRRPEPPPSLLDQDGAKRLLGLYDVAQRALGPRPDVTDDDLGVIRRSMMLDPDYKEPEEAHAQRLRERFVHRERIAIKELGFDPHAGDAPGTASEFARADLEHGGSWVATDVLLVLKQAHRYVHEVEYRRSQPVSGMLGRSKQNLADERLLLRRSIVLSTLSLVVSQVIPWAFAADAREREAIHDDPRAARQRTYPAEAMWIARQVTMLSLYRRAHGFRLLADHERSYNDYRKLQQIGRYSTPRIGGSPANLGARNAYVDILSALGEYRIGELYRSDHDYNRALTHLCAGHDRLLHAGHDDIQRAAAPREVRFPRLEVHLRLGKGTAYFETGEMTLALKWHVHAWLSLEVLIGRESARLGQPQPDRPLERVAMEALAEYLDGVRREPDLDKEKLKDHLQPTVDVMCGRDIPVTLRALAADVLGRIGHILLVLNLADNSVPLCLKRAVELDPYNLFARTALLRWRLMEELNSDPGAPRPELMDPSSLPEAVSCWPSGASDVDQAIRVGIHLLLRRLLDVARDTDKNTQPRASQDIDMRVAGALIARFIDHTDSIYLRLEVINHYLMRRRLDEQRPELAEQPSAEPYLQLVSLRRYGGLVKSVPRPGAASAVGGGYLVRVCSPATDPVKRQDVFNMLVDPGDDVIDNLYREGFGIADIDMVIVTNDHPEHLAALDAILALSDGRRPIELAARKPGGKKRDDRLVLVGTTSVLKRYLGNPRLSLRDLGKRLMVREKLPPGVAVRQLEAIYRDSAGTDPVSFVLTFNPAGEGPARSITFMSDAATEAVGDYLDGRLTAIDEEAADEWRAALASDIVVASVGEVSVGELRDLALPRGNEGTNDVADAFDDCLKGLETNGRRDEEVRIRLALSLIRGGQGAVKRAGLLQPSPWTGVEGSDHLNLRGLLAVAKMMSEPSPGDSNKQPRVLVVRELREQIGAFRRTIADEINKHLFTDRRTFAVTADVGLRIRLGRTNRSRVLCSVCSLNNDRLDAERHHDPRLMTEVPVKADGESTYWMCGIHKSESSIFIVHRGGYRPQASGGHFDD
jgi:hypothetical protein